MINTINLPPFKRMCVTIGNLPSSFMESLSYYEALCWMYNFLDKEVIPAINAESEAITELQDAFTTLKNYVDTYFDNLDIQAEINAKLDDMAESGQLTDIIAQYLQLAGVLVYNDISEMEAAENLVAGSICKTIGFHSANDGGGNYYKVRDITNVDVIDNMTLFALSDVNLVAELIMPLYITPETFGAYGDNTHDDKLAIQKCLDTNADCVYLNRNYYISDSVVFKGDTREIAGFGKLSSDNENNPALVINGANMVISLAQIYAPYCIKISTNREDFTWSQYITFRNIDLIATETCVTCERTATKWINEIHFDNVRFSGKIGVSLNGDAEHDWNFGGYRFNNCGNETCSEYFIKAYNLTDVSITNFRNNEAWDKPLMKIDNNCTYFNITTSSLVSPDYIDLNKSVNSKGIIIGSAVDSAGGNMTSISKCYNGVFTTDKDNFVVLDNSSPSYNYSTATSHILPNTYILRSVSGGRNYTITIPTNYLFENGFYIINQNPNNTLTVNYGTTTKTLTFDAGSDSYYRIFGNLQTLCVEKANITIH